MTLLSDQHILVGVDIPATIIAALMGAVVGSLGAEWLRHRLQKESTSEQTRRDLAQRHLIQLQDALESLYFRLTNMSEWGGKAVMSQEYYELSSIYALGNVLAQKRRLMLDGVYALLDTHGPDFPGHLEQGLEVIESILGSEWTPSVSFYRYERLALGESLLTRDGGWRVLTYAEFLRTQNDYSTITVLQPVREFFDRLAATQIDELRGQISEVLRLISSKTNIAVGVGRSPDSLRTESPG